jgi:hypothetical protein
MAKPLPLTDHRARRYYLEGDDYALASDGYDFVPSGRIKPETWDSIMGLSDSVAIETSDEFPAELEQADKIAWSWLDINERLPAESPVKYQTLSALETFQASVFNALNGWYRIAGASLRLALDDMFLGLYYQNRATERGKFDAITDGHERAPMLRDILPALQDAGVPHTLLYRARDWYHSVLSVHVHRRSDGTIWSSNGPVYVPKALRAWFEEYKSTYLLMCELIDSVVADAKVIDIAKDLTKV